MHGICIDSTKMRTTLEVEFPLINLCTFLRGISPVNRRCRRHFFKKMTINSLELLTKLNCNCTNNILCHTTHGNYESGTDC